MKERNFFPAQITTTAEARLMMNRLNKSVEALAELGVLPNLTRCTSDGMGDDKHFYCECDAIINYKKNLIYVTTQIAKRRGGEVTCSVYACDDESLKPLVFPELATHLHSHPCNAYPDPAEPAETPYYIRKEVSPHQLLGAFLSIITAMQEFCTK